VYELEGADGALDGALDKVKPQNTNQQQVA
jgi:hypothetical protein